MVVLEDNGTGSPGNVPSGSSLDGVGALLRQARTAAGISVREMARRISVSPSFVSQVELGRTKPSVGTLYSIASELGVPLDTLMPVAPLPPADPGVRVVRPAGPLVGPPETATPGPPAAGGPAGPSGAAEAPSGSPVQRADRRHELRMDLATWGRLTADHDADNDFLHVTYQPGGQSCPTDALIHHRGKEYGFVVSGKLTVQVGFAEYELGAGDSISFDSSTPHRLSNPFDEVSTSIWLVVGRGGTPVL